jgi:hypothetical protein
LDRTDTSSPLRDAGPVHREVMNAVEAADFLRLSEDAFKKLAPTLPRCRIYERGGYRYLRSDLLAWLRADEWEREKLAPVISAIRPLSQRGDGKRTRTRRLYE